MIVDWNTVFLYRCANQASDDAKGSRGIGIKLVYDGQLAEALPQTRVSDSRPYQADHKPSLDVGRSNGAPRDVVNRPIIGLANLSHTPNAHRGIKNSCFYILGGL